MKIFQFKLISLLGIEAICGLFYTLIIFFSSDSKLFFFTKKSLLVLMLSIPVFFILPSFNWIWIIEENVRDSKLLLREKAEKHLHLSMLYAFLFSYPGLVITIAILLSNNLYLQNISFYLIALSITFGFWCARNSFLSIISNSTIYAIYWDKRRPFVTVIFESLFPKNENSILKRNFMGGSIFIILLMFSPIIYFSLNTEILPQIDKERWLAILSSFTILLSFFTWIVSYYIFFQLLYSKPVFNWVKAEREKQKLMKQYREERKSSIA